MKNIIDRWWDRTYALQRLDRGPMYVTMQLAAFLTSLSMILLGPVPNGSISELSDIQQMTMATMLFVGSGLCLSGALTGSKFFFHSCTRIRSYGIGLTGIPLVCSSLVFYSYAVMINTPNFTSALGTTFAPLLGFGSAFNAVLFLS